MDGGLRFLYFLDAMLRIPMWACLRQTYGSTIIGDVKHMWTNCSRNVNELIAHSYTMMKLEHPTQNQLVWMKRLLGFLL